MKPIIRIRIILLALITATFLFSVTSCVTKAKFATSAVVPAARGYVKVKKDNNNNYAVQIQISNLAEVGRLQPPKLTYVVWVVSDNNETKNIGRISSSSGTFSKKLNATFKTVTSVKPTKVFITAENDEMVSYPSTEVILSTNRF